LHGGILLLVVLLYKPFIITDNAGCMRVVRKLILFLLLDLQVIILQAQISDNSYPESFLTETKSVGLIPYYELDSVKVTDCLREDKQLGIPNRYGIAEKVQVDIRTEGLETSTEDFNIWRYEIQSPDAFSLGIFFESYNLPEGARVYVYSVDKKQLRGAFTDANNKTTNQLALAAFQGNKLIVEYDEPKEAEFPGELVIGSITKAYLDLKSVSNNWIPVNCPEGEDWQNEKRAVCLILFTELPYSYYCSGSLVNNVREDETPYFLTANHCISTNIVAETVVAYFNYENSTCSSNDASMEQTLSGAELKAANSYSDFSLLELSESPPKEYTPYFAGWNASDDQPTSGTSIHHPEGSYKCIAFDYEAPESYPYSIRWDANNVTMPNTHWEISYDAGTDESGSSGCPLFDQNKRVIGQLHGGDDTFSDFGKFSVSWDYSSTSSKQLKHWLDPDNTGTLRIDGMDYSSPPLANFSSDVSLACLNTTVYFTDESKWSPTTWLWTFEPGTIDYVNGTDSTSQNPEVVFNDEGSYSVTLIASNKNGSDTITYNDLIMAVAQLDVSFPGFEDEMTLCGSELHDYLMIADGANEYSFEISQSDFFDIEYSSDSLFLTLNDKARDNGSFDTYVKVTGTHGNCSDSDSVLLHVIMPANDDIKNAITLKLGRNEYFSNQCGTVQDGEPKSGNLYTDNTIWFLFQGPTSGEMDIAIDGAATIQAIYKADSYSRLLSGSYDLIDYSYSFSDENKNTGLELEPGKLYWLQVGALNGDYGDLTIDLLSNTIEVYPNPSDGKFYFTISSKEGGSARISVYSMNGQQLLSQTSDFSIESNTIEVDMSGQANGVYILRAIINDTTMTKKIVVAK